MINDKQVKTKVSPFAVRENEIKVYDGKEGYASINQVVFKMDMGYINEQHIMALEVVNEYGFVTSRQVTQVLEARGKLADIEVDRRQDRVAKWLEDLTKSKVLARASSSDLPIIICVGKFSSNVSMYLNNHLSIISQSFHNA